MEKDISKINLPIVKNFNGIDIVKLIMAIVVISIHTHPFEECSNVYVLKIYNGLIIHMAVPFFLCTSGFLCFFNNKENKLKNYIKKTYKHYILWNCIYFPITLYNYILLGNSFKICLFDFLKNFLFVGAQYYSLPLWYLLGITYSMSLILIFKKAHMSDTSILIISIIISTICCIYKYYPEKLLSLFGENIICINFIKLLFNGNGRLFYSMLYIVIGMILAKHYTQFSIKIEYIIMCFIGFGILRMLFINSIGINDILIICFCISFFVLVLQIDIKHNKIIYWCKKCSIVFYFMHMIFFFLYTIFIKTNSYYGIKPFLTCVLGCTLFSIIVILTEKKFKFINYIFS